MPKISSAQGPTNALEENEPVTLVDTAYDDEAQGEAADLPDENSDEVRPYEEWTKEELQEELEKRGLPKSGNKDELVVRLCDNDDEADEG